MKSTHFELQQKVQAELDAYEILEADTDAIGSSLPPSWFSDRLAEMRAALVIPHAAKIRDCVEGTGELVIVNVVVVVDDRKGTIVAYDQDADTFVLAATDPDRNRVRGVDVVSCGVRGSAVDCFLSA